VVTVFGKKTVNQEELRQIMDLLHQAAQTPDHAEQDGPIAEADAVVSKINKKTWKALLVVSPPALLAIEAVHMSSVTGETVESATSELNRYVRSTGKMGYKVFWYPRPGYVISQLRELGRYIIYDELAELDEVSQEPAPLRTPTVAERLESLRVLHESGVYTDEQYERLKKTFSDPDF
jgi:hypothetical protein